jgi:hypothetical protein
LAVLVFSFGIFLFWGSNLVPLLLGFYFFTRVGVHPWSGAGRSGRWPRFSGRVSRRRCCETAIDFHHRVSPRNSPVTTMLASARRRRRLHLYPLQPLHLYLHLHLQWQGGKPPSGAPRSRRFGGLTSVGLLFRPICRHQPSHHLFIPPPPLPFPILSLLLSVPLRQVLIHFLFSLSVLLARGAPLSYLSSSLL